MKSSPTCSIVIPVFNSQDSLIPLVEQLVTILTGLRSEFEIILVNDGSRDKSWQVIEKICAENSKIRAFDLSRNFGQHNALLCGIRNARYELIITMDDDLQHPPAEILTLMTKLEEGYDLVYGTAREEVHGFWRNTTSRMVKWALKTSVRIPYAEKISAFRIFRTSLRESFAHYSNVYVSIDVLLSWGAARIGFVDVAHDERSFGKSQYTFKKLVKHTLNMVLGFSVLPLRIASILGFGFTIFGFLILAYVLVRYLIHGGSVPGFSFLASTVAIFSGIILFVLGIMGEYLARMFTTMMANQPYYVSKKIGDNHE